MISQLETKDDQIEAGSIHPLHEATTTSRRLHSRFPVEIAAVMRFYKPHSDSVTEVAAMVVDVSPDSLAIRLHRIPETPVGANVTIVMPVREKPTTFNGTVVYNLPAPDDHARVGIALAPDSKLNPAELAGNQVSVDRRQQERRTAGPPEGGRRQFERRGLWPGLLPKREFSQRVMELKNASMYFFMEPLSSASGAHVIVGGREMIMMSSNNYLGLSTHPKVIEASIQALRTYGSSSSSSSLLGGTLDIHLQLEEDLARFKGVEAAAVFSSGYVTNLSTLVALLRKGDEVFIDQLDHASIVDGARISGADIRLYRHVNMRDLESKLARSRATYKLVPTDSVFSMDGDVAPLPEIFRLCMRYGAALMIDEAHATGVFGEHGRGSLEHFHMEGKAAIVMGTLGKSLAGIGGFIGGSRELIQILKHSARAFVFSTYLPPSVCATVITCLKLIDEEPERRIQLWRNADRMRSGLQSLGFNTSLSQSPIIPVVFPTELETNLMTKGLRDAGIYVSPVVPPAVAPNATRIRLTVMATHTDQDIDMALDAFKRVRTAVPSSLG